MSVVVPDGCLLVQAGQQMEHLTGGYVLAGYHEVITTQATLDVIERKKEEGRSLWRVSSTLFSHIQSDQLLQPLGAFATPKTNAMYPVKSAGDQVQEELAAINLAKV